MVREFTTDEIQEEFLDYLQVTLEYWLELPNKTVRERMEGLMFSVLVCLDGGTNLPGFVVAPDPCEGDKEYYQENDENWYPENTEVNGNIAGTLHEIYSHRRKS